MTGSAVPAHDGAMELERWTTVDGYLNGLLAPGDQALTAALDASRAAGLPEIQVAPNQGKLLHLLARMVGTRRILEVGTLGGYSTIWLARALPPGGTLTTLEVNPRHAEVAWSNIERAGLAPVVDIQVGPAMESLSRLVDNAAEPYDLTFIDADKPNNANYFSSALRLSRSGSVIVIDNVVRQGAIADGSSDDPSVEGSQRLLAALAAEPRVDATAIQTVGGKGYDGFALALVTG